jgi:hypothetical protein
MKFHSLVFVYLVGTSSLKLVAIDDQTHNILTIGARSTKGEAPFAIAYIK